MDGFIEAFLPAFVSILLIVDPLPSIPIFLSLTKKFTPAETKVAATKAILIAAVLAIIFLFVGPQLLSTMGVTVGDFKIAGGFVLVLLGLESVLDFTLPKSEEEKKKGDDLETVTVLIATPLLTGPGLMTGLVILAKEQGFVLALTAAMAAMVVSWILLYNAQLIRKVLGEQILTIFSKVVGLVVMAMGVGFIKAGLA